MRREVGWLIVASLFACGDRDPKTPEPDTGEVEDDELVECAPKTLEFGLSSMISGCADAECDQLTGPWHGLMPEAAHYDLTLAAECTVASSRELIKGVTRWVFDDCEGDKVPADGTLVLTWEPSEPLPLPLTVGETIHLRYRAIGSLTGHENHHAWSLRDDSDTVLAFHSGESFMPDPWLTEPIVLTASHQDCSSTEQCGGTAFRDRIEFRGGGGSVNIADGNAGTFANGATVYDAFVFAAYSGSGFDCGVSSDASRYTLAFIAR